MLWHPVVTLCGHEALHISFVGCFAFVANAFDQHRCWLIVATLAPSELCFSWYKISAKSLGQDRLGKLVRMADNTITLFRQANSTEDSIDTSEPLTSGIYLREEYIERRDDPTLLVERRERDRPVAEY